MRRAPKPKKSVKTIYRMQTFLEERPVIGYIMLTFALMFLVLVAEQGAVFLKASILQVPKFDGTALPIRQVPDWVQTGGKNDRLFGEYAASELVTLPKYDGRELERRCAAADSAYRNACITFPTVYMGTYQMDHKEMSGSHLAIDIRVPKGTPVYAVANGIIETAVEQTSGFGKYVVIRHPDVPLPEGGRGTLYSGYAHLSSLVKKSGEFVRKGELIAYSGDTGTSTTPHLHFQIDRDNTPWHPWWPFTAGEAAAAGVSFFEGINIGLGKAEAIKKTVNPLLWVQQHYAFVPSSSEAPVNKPQAATPAVAAPLERFELRADKSAYSVGETALLSVVAYDKNNNIVLDYTGNDARFAATPDALSVPALAFRHGKSAATVPLGEPGQYTFSIRDGQTTASLLISVTAGATASATPQAEVSVPPSLEGGLSLSGVAVSSDKQTLFPGDTARVSFMALDAGGQVISSPRFPADLEVVLEGSGSIEPKVLKDRYFKDGIATVTYTAGATAGRAIISLGRFPNDSVAFDIVTTTEPVTRFDLSTDGRFQVGKPETVTIKTVDAEGKPTLASFIGKAYLTISSGTGKLSTTELVSRDFKNGIATVTLTPTASSPISLKIKSGALVGESKQMIAGDERGSLFSDVPDDHPYRDAIETLKAKAVFAGNPDGSFRPESGINRAEFAKVILLALGINPRDPQGGKFTDVPRESWFAPFAETAAFRNIIKGYPDGRFGPTNQINRAELFTMLARADNKPSTRAATFADVPKDSWFAEGAAFAQQYRLLDFGGRFEPESIMTRGEVAEALARFIEL